MQNVTVIHNFHKSAALMRNIFAIFLIFVKPMLTLHFFFFFNYSLIFGIFFVNLQFNACFATLIPSLIFLKTPYIPM
jgi:hypothetical protein